MEVAQVKLEDKLFLDRYIVDENHPHLKIKSSEVCEQCEKKACLYACPAGVYQREGDRISVAYADCLECGTCRLVCQEHDNIEWNYPRGGFGVSFKFG